MDKAKVRAQKTVSFRPEVYAWIEKIANVECRSIAGQIEWVMRQQYSDRLTADEYAQIGKSLRTKNFEKNPDFPDA